MSTFLAGLLLFNLAAVDEIAIDWAATPADCLPGEDAIDWRAEVHGDAGVIMWWCEDAKYGMVEHSRVSQRGGNAARKLLVDARDAAMIIQSAPFRLRPVDADGVLVASMRHRYTPLCTAADSHAKSPAGEALGELRLGQRIACGGLKTSEEGQHYCNVPGAWSLNGTLLPADSWVRCEVVRAPTDGWVL